MVTASGGPFRGRRRSSLAEVTPDRGAGPPDVVDGPGGHDQQRDAGQQGSRGDRGPPAVRHPVRPDRRGRAPAERRPLDGAVHRRLHARPGVAAGHAAADRARHGLARAGARCGPVVRLEQGRDLGVPPVRRRGVPRRGARPRGRRQGRHVPRGVQRGQRGVRRGVPGRAAAVPRHRRHRGGGRRRAPIRRLGNSLSVADVLSAEAWARDRARALSGLADPAGAVARGSELPA